MTFWHNEKYSSLDKAAKTGDFLRGLPGTKFPWLVSEKNFIDDHGDAWTLKAFCTKVDTLDHSNKLKAQILLEARCTLGEGNLLKMGAHSQRLNEIGFKDWDSLLEQCTLSFLCPLEQITEKTKPLLALFFNKVKIKYSFEHKQVIVKEKIKNFSISNFVL